MPRRHSLAALLSFCSFCLFGAPENGSAVTQNGSQFQVNTYTTNNQYLPSVASDASGNFVVVWTSYGSAGSDTDLSVQGQRYGANGSAIGSPFQVNTYTTNTQAFPVVASASNGSFVVVWQSAGADGDNDLVSIQGQRYDSTGAAVGTQFQVNTYTTSGQSSPSVASDSAGNFVVVWKSYGSSSTDTSLYSIQGQRYGAGGAAIGGQFQVNTYTTGQQFQPKVASDSAGNFVVVWQSYGSFGSDSSSSIQGQRYDSTGAAVGTQFQVNTYTTGTQFVPAVTRDSAGGYVVVWASNGSDGGDSSASSIQGQRYDSSGAAVGAQFQVNTYTTSYQDVPNVASDAYGDFVVVWRSAGSSGNDTSSYSIQAKTYDASGATTGAEFQVNTYTTSLQLQPSVASDPTGKFVAAWTSNGSAGGDTSQYSVQAQRYLPEPALAPALAAMLAPLLALARRRDPNLVRRTN